MNWTSWPSSMQRALLLPAECSGKTSADLNGNRAGTYYFHIKYQLYIDNKQYNSTNLAPVIDNLYGGC